MSDTFTLHLNNPLTEEDWDKLTDAELEHTERIWYSTPSGKRVEFINANVINEIMEEIVRKKDSGQWSTAVQYGMLKAIWIIDRYRQKEGDGK